MRATLYHDQKGLTLIELMIAMALGLILSVAIIQVLVSNRVTDDLNNALASAQENGRYIISRLRADLLMVGYYNPISPMLNRKVDIAEENIFVRNSAIVLPGNFIARPALGSIEGSDEASDELVVSKQEQMDCRGYKLGYASNEEFHVVNQYFLQGNELKCRGFDGRVLRAQQVAVGHNNHASVTLLENVLSFQVMYGITDGGTDAGRGTPVQYVDASQLSFALANNASVVSIRIAIVVKGDGDGFVQTPATFKLLNENTITAPDKGLYKAFETTIALRNARHFARGSA